MLCRSGVLPRVEPPASCGATKNHRVPPVVQRPAQRGLAGVRCRRSWARRHAKSCSCVWKHEMQCRLARLAPWQPQHEGGTGPVVCALSLVQQQRRTRATFPWSLLAPRPTDASSYFFLPSTKRGFSFHVGERWLCWLDWGFYGFLIFFPFLGVASHGSGLLVLLLVLRLLASLAARGA